MSKTKAEVQQLQRLLNAFTGKYLSYVAPIQVDGVIGEETKKRIRSVKWYLGYPEKERTAAAGHELMVRLRHPKQVNRYAPPRRLAVAAKRRVEQRRKARAKPLRERAFAQAELLVGVMEHGGNNRGREVEEIIRENGGIAGEPWCGDFVAHCYRAAGSKRVQRAWASVAMLGNLVGVTKTSSPKRGDLVRFTFDHVGLY